MRWRLSFAGVILFVLAAAPPRPGSGGKGPGTDPLAPGNNLPATFHPLNINKLLPVSAEPEDGKTGEKKGYTTEGKYHCLISEYDLDPVVMILAKGMDDNPALRGLLEKLNGLVDRNT